MQVRQLKVLMGRTLFAFKHCKIVESSWKAPGDLLQGPDQQHQAITNAFKGSCAHA